MPKDSKFASGARSCLNPTTLAELASTTSKKYAGQRPRKYFHG